MSQPHYDNSNGRDKVVEAVRKDLLDRSMVGIKKYKTTLDKADLSLKEWLQHALEEAMDMSLYLKSAILRLEQEENNKLD